MQSQRQNVRKERISTNKREANTLFTAWIRGDLDVMLTRVLWRQKPASEIMESTAEFLTSQFGRCKGNEHIRMMNSAFMNISLVHIPA